LIKQGQLARHEQTGFEGIVISRLVPISVGIFIEIGIQNKFGSVQFFDERDLILVREEDHDSAGR